ncbi:MAG: hypothetical protein IPN42_02695 [Methylococcaceae bacterium]|nr:hypothetical protein [Methylococcaceae bacterium]
MDKIPGIRPFYRSLLRRLVKKSQLFDQAFYLEHNQDVAQSGISPIKHYVLIGDRESRFPMPFSIRVITVRIPRVKPKKLIPSSITVISGDISVFRQVLGSIWIFISLTIKMLLDRIKILFCIIFNGAALKVARPHRTLTACTT